MVAGFKLTGSGEYIQSSRSGRPSGHLLHNNPAQQKKGFKALAGLVPDPRKVIPLDSKDSSILSTF